MKRCIALGLALCLIAGAAASQERAMTVEEMEEAFGLKPATAPSTPASPPTRKPKYRAPTFEFGGPSEPSEPPAQASGSPVVINKKPAPGFVAMPVEFTIDSARIAPAYEDNVLTVAELMQRHPSLTLIIRGHTDATGDASHNQALSQERAAAVRHYLISKGIAPHRLKSEGRGESELLPGEKADGARNRRVEFIRSDQH